MKTTRLAFALSVLLSALPARAADWSVSFPPASVASHLETPGQAILVAAAGEEGEARDAALALGAAFRAGGKARLVMDGASLGKVAGLGDAEIVQRCAALPVETIAVVRVFPGAAGAPASAVVTFYDKKGSARVAFSTEEGKPLAAKEGAGAGGGVSTLAVQAVQKVETAMIPGTDAQQSYEEKYLWFGESVWVNPQTGGVVSRHTVAYQGKHPRELARDEFYELAGRPDLAAKYRKKSLQRSVLSWGGGILILGGAALVPMGLSPSNCTGRDSYGQCQGRSSTLFYMGAGAVGVGLVSLFVGGAIDPEPVPEHEARGLADEHNKKLKAELGLTAQRDAKPRGEQPIALQVAAFPLRQGGGVALGAQW